MSETMTLPPASLADDFTAVVRRHVHYVYSAALRQTRDAHLAEDVTQAVFIMLARKKLSLDEPALTVWLYRATLYAAANARRSERRRNHHEGVAGAMKTTEQPGHAPHTELADVLDQAVSRLPVAERRTVLLHYFQQQPLPQVAADLQLSEPATRTRLSRALRKLRRIMTSMGVTVSAVTLISFLETNAVQAAPAALATSCIGAASTPTGAAAMIAKGALAAMSKLKLILVAAIATPILVAGLFAVTQMSTMNKKTPVVHRPALLVPVAAEQDWIANTIKLLEPAGESPLNLTSPRATFDSFYIAIRNGDLNTARACMDLDPSPQQERIFKAYFGLAYQKGRYKREALKAFGDELTGWKEPPALAEWLDYWSVNWEHFAGDVQGDRFDITVNYPPLTNSPNGTFTYGFRKLENRWLLSQRYIVRMHDLAPNPEDETERYIRHLDRTAQIWSDYADKITANEFQSFADCEQERNAKWVQLKKEFNIKTSTFMVEKR